jgi:hypothetical protein
MIPTIEQICEDLKAGLITVHQAIEWLHIHAQDAGAELRDSFAMTALQGLCAKAGFEKNEHGNIKTREHSALAYQYADAMLAARATYRK